MSAFWRFVVVGDGGDNTIIYVSSTALFIFFLVFTNNIKIQGWLRWFYNLFLFYDFVKATLFIDLFIPSK
jgi:hypothetical protein